MGLRNLKSGLNYGSYRWVRKDGQIVAKSEFQRKRVAEAVKIARAYLTEDVNSTQIAKMLGVTRMRVQQILTTGTRYMLDNGWILEVKR